jgi:hypothetical protein
VRKLQPLLDADWLVLDPIDDAGSPMVSTMRMHGLELPRRMVHSASNLLGLQLATQTDLISMWSDFVFHGAGPLRLQPGLLEKPADHRRAARLRGVHGLPLGRPDDAHVRRVRQGGAAPGQGESAVAPAAAQGARG